MALEALLLDFDGLIVDSETAEFAALTQVFTSRGHHLDVDEWRATLGTVGHDWLGRLAPAGTDAHRTLHARFERAQRSLVARAPTRPGVTALVDMAAARGVRVAVVTSGDRSRVEPELERRGLLRSLSALVTGDEDLPRKPSPAPYLEALRRLRSPASAAIAFEDTSHGVVAAVAAGIRCVAVPTCHTRSHRFEGAAQIVDQVDQVDFDALMTSRIVRTATTTAHRAGRNGAGL